MKCVSKISGQLAIEPSHFVLILSNYLKFLECTSFWLMCTCIFYYSRLVKQIVDKEQSSKDPPRPPLRWQASALEALQVSAELHLTNVLEQGNMLALHAKRQTLEPRDLQAAAKIRGDTMPDRVRRAIMQGHYKYGKTDETDWEAERAFAANDTNDPFRLRWQLESHDP